MNLEKRFNLFQDFLREMSNGAIIYVRSVNLTKLERPLLRYEAKTFHRDTFHMEDINMMVHVTEYVFTIDIISKCHMDQIWCDELTQMFRGTFSSLLPPNCKVEIIPLTNEPIPNRFYA